MADREVAKGGPHAAIHASSYTVAGPYCSGKRVLAVTWESGDVGPALLAQEYGAANVTAVDVSGVPVDGLTKVFSPQNLQWKQASLEDLTSLFEAQAYDVAVAVGVVEHVAEPGILFAALRTVVHHEGQIVISAPNDLAERQLAVQPDGTEVSRFAENTFRDLAETVLGPCSAWIKGTAVEGYLNIIDVADREPQALDDGGVRLMAGEGTALAGDASYFVGVWGDGARTPITGALLTSSQTSARGEEAQHDACESTLQQAQAELGRVYLQLRAAQEEMYIIRDSVGLLVTAGSQELRDAIDAQAKLVDERDDYIKVLEARVNALTAELKELIDATDWYRRRPKVRKTVEMVVNYRQRKPAPTTDDPQ